MNIEKTNLRSKFDKKHIWNMCKARKVGYLDKITNNKKLCSKCNKLLLLNEFNKSTKRTNGYQLWCKNCHNKEKKRTYFTYRKNMVRLLARKTQLKTKYNLSLEDYNKLLKKQNYVCAICKKQETQHSSPNGVVDSLRVDHNHKNQQIRGLLCSKCNFGISQFNDNIYLLKKAIRYLKQNEKISLERN